MSRHGCGRTGLRLQAFDTNNPKPNKVDSAETEVVVQQWRVVQCGVARKQADAFAQALAAKPWRLSVPEQVDRVGNTHGLAPAPLEREVQDLAQNQLADPTGLASAACAGMGGREGVSGRLPHICPSSACAPTVASQEAGAVSICSSLRLPHGLKATTIAGLWSFTAALWRVGTARKQPE